MSVSYYDESGSGTAAAAIGAFATIAAALIGGIFLLASNRASTPGAPSNTAPPTDFSVATAIFLSVDNGPTGTSVSVSGEGFGAGERIVLRFHTNQIGTTQANEAGNFSNVTVEIPSGFADFAPNQFAIIAVGQSSSRSADAPFTLTG